MVMLAAGASYVCALADEIDERCGGKRISTIDIGGGLPSNYSSSESMGDFTFSGYVDALQKDCPAILNTTDRRVVTNLGAQSYQNLMDRNGNRVREGYAPPQCVRGRFAAQSSHHACRR